MNGSGNIPSDLTVFDQLPPEIKRVLHHAPRPFAPAQVLKSYKDRGSPPVGEYVAHMIRVLKKRYPRWTPPSEIYRDVY